MLMSSLCSIENEQMEMTANVDLELLSEFLANVLGKNAEVVVHDLSDLEHSLKVIKNGYITYRKQGDPATDLTLKMIRDCLQQNTKPFTCNYNGKTIAGKRLRSSSMVIPDKNGNPSYMLCINIDSSDVQVLLERALNLVTGEEIISNNEITSHEEEELYSESIEKVGEKVLQVVMSEYSSNPDNISLREKREIIYKLEKKGLFLIKGFVSKVSCRLSVSEPTIYRYLKE